MCWPCLTEDCVASHTTLSQQLEQILQALREALELPGTGPTLHAGGWGAGERMQMSPKGGEETAEWEETLWLRDLGLQQWALPALWLARACHLIPLVCPPPR